MSGVFEDLSNFNEDISLWNVAGVMDMSHMFKGARSFDQPIGNWQTSLVTTMAHMFDGAAAFNHEIASWDVSNVETMSHMFHGAVAFNQPLEAWDTSRVADMTALFSNAESFNPAACQLEHVLREKHEPDVPGCFWLQQASWLLDYRCRDPNGWHVSEHRHLQSTAQRLGCVCGVRCEQNVPKCNRL